MKSNNLRLKQLAIAFILFLPAALLGQVHDSTQKIRGAVGGLFGIWPSDAKQGILSYDSTISFDSLNSKADFLLFHGGSIHSFPIKDIKAYLDTPIIGLHTILIYLKRPEYSIAEQYRLVRKAFAKEYGLPNDEIAWIRPPYSWERALMLDEAVLSSRWLFKPTSEPWENKIMIIRLDEDIIKIAYQDLLRFKLSEEGPTIN